MDEFSENFRRGGGVISDPKNFVAVFAVILRGKNDEFAGKEGGSLQSEKFVAKKHNIVFRNEGGGSEAVWKVSENSSKILQLVVPNRDYVLINCAINSQAEKNFR